MTEEHAELLQVALGQQAQCIEIHAVVGEDRDVLLQARLLEQGR